MYILMFLLPFFIMTCTIYGVNTEQDSMKKLLWEQRVTVVVRFSVCCECVFYQHFWTSNNIGTLIDLPTDLEFYKDQNKRQSFSKTFQL